LGMSMSRLPVFLGAAVLSATLASADERDVIAHAFHADSQYVVLNLPPRPDAWPGAIFTANLRLPIVHGDPKDSALHIGRPVGITTDEGFDLGASAKGGLSEFFGVSASAGNVANVSLSFPDARVIDMDVEDLIKHVLASGYAIDDAKRGHIPLIVVTAYAGTPTITISKNVNASAGAWAKAKSDIHVGVKASVDAGNMTVYKGNDEIVFAFETSEIHFDPNDLIKGSPRIQLSSLPEPLYALRQDDNDKLLARVLGKVTGQNFEAAAKERPMQGITGGPSSVFKRGKLGCIFSSNAC